MKSIPGWIFSAILLAFVTVGFESEGSTARSELEKKGYTYNESSFVDSAKKGDLEAVWIFPKKVDTVKRKV